MRRIQRNLEYFLMMMELQAKKLIQKRVDTDIRLRTEA